MCNVGVFELILFAFPASVVFVVVFFLGFFAGKSVGFKQGLREPRRP
jgi:hypothetical protein